MSNYKFETLQLHVGQEQADPATDSRAVPIYQTTSYVFRNSQHAADRFGLADAGNIYGRLTNSTQDVFEKRIAALEGGVAALATASGAAAITYTIEALAQAGDHIVAQKTIYGGSYNLLEHTLTQFGVTTTFVNAHDLAEVENAIQPNTKAVYLETLGNPNSDIPDIDAIAAIDQIKLAANSQSTVDLSQYVPMAVYQEAVAKVGSAVADAKAKEIDDLITAACSDGRLTGDATINWIKDQAQTNPDFVKAHIESLPKIAALTQRQTEQVNFAANHQHQPQPDDIAASINAQFGL